MDSYFAIMPCMEKASENLRHFYYCVFRNKEIVVRQIDVRNRSSMQELLNNEKIEILWSLKLLIQ